MTKTPAGHEILDGGQRLRYDQSSPVPRYVCECGRHLADTKRSARGVWKAHLLCVLTDAEFAEVFPRG